MYVYHLKTLPNYNLLSVPIDVFLRNMQRLPVRSIQGYSPGGLEADRVEFSKLIKLIGFNGIVTSGVRVFLGVNPLVLTPGFILIQATDGHAFVGSPHELPHLNSEAIDRTDSDEKARTIAGMLGHEFTEQEGPPVTFPGWKISQKGNLWTTIEGVNCVIVEDNPRGHIGLLRGDGHNRIATRSFNTTQEVADYIVRRFRTLIKVWAPKEESDDDDDSYFDSFGSLAGDDE